MSGRNTRRQSQTTSLPPRPVIPEKPKVVRPRGLKPPPAEFVVERIVKKNVEKGKVWYRVKWQGWPSNRNTWEPEAGLLGTCKGAIDEFNEQNEFLREHGIAVDQFDDDDDDDEGKKAKQDRNKRRKNKHGATLKRKPKPKSMVSTPSETDDQMPGESNGNVDVPFNDFSVPGAPVPKKRRKESSDGSERAVKEGRSIKVEVEETTTEDTQLNTSEEEEEVGTEDISDYELEQPRIWIDYPVVARPLRIISTIPIGSRLVYCVEYERNGLKKKIYALSDSFKLKYPDIIIRFYEERLDWIRDPGLVTKKQNQTPVTATPSNPDPVPGTSKSFSFPEVL